MLLPLPGGQVMQHRDGSEKAVGGSEETVYVQGEARVEVLLPLPDLYTGRMLALHAACLTPRSGQLQASHQVV